MASYAAAIKSELGFDAIVETGLRGQFDVLVDGQKVVSRKGGLLALITRKPWPSTEDVVSAVKSLTK